MRRSAPVWARRRDRIEKPIVLVLDTIPGISVLRLTQGGGVHDLLIGGRCKCGELTNRLIELKDDETGDLTPAQIEFHLGWRGQSAVATSLDEVLEIIGVAGGSQGGRS